MHVPLSQHGKSPHGRHSGPGPAKLTVALRENYPIRPPPPVKGWKIPDFFSFFLTLSLHNLFDFLHTNCCYSFFSFYFWVQMSFLVFAKISPPLGLIITEVTPQNIITVLCWDVFPKITSICSLIIALITRDLYTIMFLKMFLKMTPLCSFVVTLITRKP